MMWLFISFAGSAVLLAAIGACEVVSFSTSQRMYEMGVRIALGATRRDLFGLILKLSLRLALVGLGNGVLLAFAATRTLANFLYGVGTRDPLIFLAVGAVADRSGHRCRVRPSSARRASRSHDGSACRVTLK